MNLEKWNMYNLQKGLEETHVSEKKKFKSMREDKWIPPVAVEFHGSAA
jgi:hypothetical protein